MKHWITFLFALCSSTISAQQTPYQLWGAVRDAFTKESIRNVHLTLMTPDSVEIVKMYLLEALREVPISL